VNRPVFYLLLAGLVFIPGKEAAGQNTTVKSDWPTYHGGYSLNGVADTTLPDSPARLWRFKAGYRVDATPILAGGRIFFTAAGGRLYALDTRGRKKWRVNITEDAFTAPPMHTAGMVLVGSRKGRLLAFEAATGKRRWEYHVGGSILGTANRVALAGGKQGIIVISQINGAIHCVDSTTGKNVWKTGAVDRCDGSASVLHGRIVMGSCASALHVFLVAKAKKTADIPLGPECQVAGGVALSGGLAFVGTRSGNVCAVDVAAGKIVWTARDSESEAFTTPAVDEKHVVFGADDGNVFCLDRTRGRKLWQFSTGESPSSPVIAANRVVVSSGGVLFLLDRANGRKVWSARVCDRITSPAVASGMVLVGADDGTVTAFGRKKRT